MRLFQRLDRIKIKFFDKNNVEAESKRGYKSYDLEQYEPRNNTKLFTVDGVPYVWTVKGIFNIKTGEEVHFSPEKIVNTLQLLEDNEPYREKRGNEEWESHPSYGLISLHETSGCAKLFGAPLEDSHYITLKIRRAMKRDGDYKEEYFHDRTEIVEIRMSFVQLAELLFYSNHGDGIPCTIAWSEMDGYIPEPPYRNYLDTIPEQFQMDVNNGMNALDSVISDVKNRLDEKGSVSKAYLKELLDKIEFANRKLTDHSGYFAKRFADNIADVKTAVLVESKKRIETELKTQIDSLVHSAEGQKLLLERLSSSGNKSDKVLTESND